METLFLNGFIWGVIATLFIEGFILFGKNMKKKLSVTTKGTTGGNISSDEKEDNKEEKTKK